MRAMENKLEEEVQKEENNKHSSVGKESRQPLTTRAASGKRN